MNSEVFESEGSILDQIIDAPLWQRVLFFVILAVIIIFTLKNIVFYGQTQKIQTLKKNLFNQQQTLHNYPTVKQNLEDYQLQLQKTVSQNRSALITQTGFPLALAKLSGSAQGIAIRKMRPGKENSGREKITKPLYLAVEGSLPATSRFIETINNTFPGSTIDRIIMVERKKAYYSEIYLTVYLSR